MVMRVITRLAGGGPPVHATLLNRQLSKHGFDSVLVFGDCSPDEMNMEYLLSQGDRVERIPTLGANPNPAFDLIALFQLWRLMRRYRPSIVHTHTAKAGFLGRIAACLAGVPCVVHTYHGHVLEGYFGSSMNALLGMIERSLAHFSTALCTVSLQQADELSAKFSVAPREKFHVVPLGLDLGPYLSISVPDFNADRLTVGWMGRFVPIKNLPLLIEIVELADVSRLPLDFLIAGDGPERSLIEEEIRARQLSNIRILPWQDRVEAVLEKCHFLLLTSHREGTPLALIQGMAAARPFVATPAGGTVDLTSGPCRMESTAWWHDNAVLCTPQAAAFVEVFKELLADRSKLTAMSIASRALALRSFAEPRLLSDISSLYRELLSQKSPERATVPGANG
jgi:glycosyltransferase involved in cell wall biosynthesis